MVTFSFQLDQPFRGEDVLQKIEGNKTVSDLYLLLIIKKDLCGLHADGIKFSEIHTVV